MKNFSFLMLFLGLFSIAQISHAAVIVNYDIGTISTVSSIINFDTAGDNMDGMRVVAQFGDGSTDILTWATTGVNAGGVAGVDWSLSFAGPTTFSPAWVLNYTGPSYLDSIFIDAGLGNTVFDTTFPSTPGSAGGFPFAVTGGGAGLDIVATYSGAIALNGNPPVGDLYRTLTLDFSVAGPNQGAGGLTGQLSFRADTDNVRNLISVSEPSSLMLLLLAAAGLVFSRRRG